MIYYYDIKRYRKRTHRAGESPDDGQAGSLPGSERGPTHTAIYRLTEGNSARYPDIKQLRKLQGNRPDAMQRRALGQT